MYLELALIPFLDRRPDRAKLEGNHNTAHHSRQTCKRYPIIEKDRSVFVGPPTFLFELRALV